MSEPESGPGRGHPPRASGGSHAGAEWYRALFETAPDAIFVADVESGQILDANRAALALTGRSLEETCRLRAPDLSPPRERAVIAERFREGARTGSGFLGERTLLGREGEEIPVEISTSGFTDVGGRKLVFGIFRDLRARNQALDALRTSEGRLREALEGAREAVWELNLATGASWRNPRWYTMLGYEPDEFPVTGLADWAGLLHPDDRAGALASLIEQIEKGLEYGEAEYRARAKDGSWRWILARWKPVERSAEGRVLRVAGTNTDVTQRRNAEEALRRTQSELVQAQKMEAVGRLAGGVAHDFNNLLSVIQGYAELMGATLPAESPDREKLDEILRAAQRAAGLTRQLLAFSRRQILEPRILDLRTVVAETKKMLGRLIGEDIRLEALLPRELPPVKADPGQIEQVLMNLAVNARDAMPAGGTLTLELSARTANRGESVAGEALAPGRWVVLGVRDTGCGMADEVKQRIFEPFFTTKEKGKGTGLGLSTVYGIVRQSGGLIGVESAPGRGTLFLIYLPAVDAPAEEDVEGGAADDDRAQGETLLVVEDDDAVRRLARAILEAKGYRVLEARDGPEAFALEAKFGETIDLLLTDVVLPGESGRVVSQKLHQRRPDLKTVFMSGYAEEFLERSLEPDEALVILPKPFTSAALSRAVRTTLRRGKLTRSGLFPRPKAPEK